MSSSPNKLTHFEIYGKQPARLAEFYETLLDWPTEKAAGFDYWTISSGSFRNGILTHPKFKGWINYIQVESIDEIIDRVIKLGGKIERPKQAVPRIAWMAVVSDPEDNLFAVWQSDKQAFPLPEPEV